MAPDYAPAEKIGAYEDELWPYCRTLKNFFAITEDYLPTKFENYMEYFGIDEAKNLVFNFEMPVVEQHPSAPGRRASEITTVVEKYALVVRLDDKVNDDLGADGYKQNVYFNDVNFKAQSAKYTATFKYANRSLVMPFNADAPEGAKVTCYEDSYMNEAGDEVIFRFTQKKTLGVIDNTITANRPYIIKAKAGDVVFAGEEVAIGLSSDNTTADLSLRIGEELIKCATMTGLYEYKYADYDENADPIEYEYLDATNQAENNGGKIKWQFSEFKHSFSPKTIVPDVTGHVEVYEDDNRVQTRERTTDPFTERSAYQMQAGSWYQVKAYGTYKYNVKVLKETDANGYALSPDVQPYAEVTNEQKEVKSDVVTTMKKQWMGSGLNPNNIHVGPIMEGDEQVATLVAMNHLPADAPDFVMGTLFYKTADMTAFDQVLVNLWPNSNIAEFVVPVAEDFDFYIILVTKVSGNKPNLVEMRKKDGSQIIAHCTMGGANAFDLTDRPLLWGAGQPAYMLPVTENDPSVNRQHYVLEFKRAGGQNSHTVYGAPASINELDEEGNVVSTTNFAKFDLTTTTAALDETTEFEYVKVSVNSHSYLEALKENWQYYTSEGAHIVDLATLIPFNPLNQEEMNNLADILCEGAVFSGNVTPIDPRVGKNDAPLMSVTDPTKPAPLYFFDWAWTPKTAPVIGKIMIEHKDYVKHYTCETMTEWTD